MSYTLGQLADFALEEIGIASYQFDITPEMRQSVIARGQMMIAEWATKGIGLGFPISKEEDSDPSEDSAVPDWAWKAIVLNLAIEIAPSYGKTVAVETKAGAKSSFDTLLRKSTNLKEIQYPSMPKGAGYKVTRDTRYTPVPGDPYLKPDDDSIDLMGEPE